jgi:hypothetical protein
MPLVLSRMASRAKTVVCRGENVDDRRVQISVRKLAANSGVCAILERLVFSIVTLDEGFKIG